MTAICFLFCTLCAVCVFFFFCSTLLLCYRFYYIDLFFIVILIIHWWSFFDNYNALFCFAVHRCKHYIDMYIFVCESGLQQKKRHDIVIIMVEIYGHQCNPNRMRVIFQLNLYSFIDQITEQKKNLLLVYACFDVIGQKTVKIEIVSVC